MTNFSFKRFGMSFLAAISVSVISSMPLLGVESSVPQVQAEDSKQSLQTIDKELEKLYVQLKEKRKLSYTDELEAQNYLRTNYQEYIEKVKLDENEERQIQEIKKQIKILKSKKEEILKNKAGK